ncbi:MAG: ATP-binding protein [Bdellovibrionia bacterium]
MTEKALARQASEHSKRMIEIERQNFRNLFKQTPEMVCILYGPDHVFEFVNEAHIRALGFDATGMSVRQAQPESVEVHGILDNVYRTGKTAELFEIPITVTDRVRYFNLTFAARRDEQGQVNGVMILGTEVTEQVLAREELKHAVSARDTFMSIASHELKTPLTSLKLQTQFRARSIQRGEWERFAIEKLPRLISDDEKQINRLIRLVDDMLDVSRIQTGKLTLVGEQFDFSEMIHETLSRFSAQIEMQGCEVSLDVDGDLTGVWDRFRMEQVFTNLLTNALKYGCGKPIEVKLCRAGDQVILTVKDQGLGIAPIDQERVFGQFERAISANTISGLGLGLFISKKIIEAHHGRISVESELEKGSTFTVELPVVSILQQVSRSAEKPEN